MSTEQSTSDTWGARQQSSPPGTWSGKRIAVAVAVAVGIAGAGATAVYAASDSSDSGSTSAQGGPGGGTGGPPDGGPGGMGGGMGALSEALHGEYVVSDGDGGYTTELLQNGEVTAISDTSVTVESEDGYTKTYTIDADTATGNDSADLSDIATGDDVTVTADESGTAATLVEAGQPDQAPPDGSTQGN